MDGERFDLLTRGLASRLASRRRLAGAAVGAALLGGLGLLPESTAAQDDRAQPNAQGKNQCDKNEERCGKRCIKKCPKKSRSNCCFGKFPKCCPKGTLKDSLCCRKNKPVCCPPIPGFPKGYCCPRGTVCDRDDECVRRNGLTTEAVAGSAPGRGSFGGV